MKEKLRNFFSFVLVTFIALFAGAIGANATPEVTAELKEVTTNTMTITFTPNDEVMEFYMCQFDKDDMENQFNLWKPSSAQLFGATWSSPADMIKQWGAKETKVCTKTWTKLVPAEEYDICVVCYDANGKVAPIQTFTYKTATKGGEGASVVNIEIKELTQKDGVYLQRIVCTANDQTLRFYSQPWPDQWVDEEGVEHRYDPADAKADFEWQNSAKEIRDTYALYDVDDWTWEVQEATKYHATAMGVNANGEWGEMTEVVFTTPGYIDTEATSLWWGYGDGSTIAFSNGPSKSTTLAGAIKFPDNVLQAYDGATLTDIRFAVAGDGSCSDVSYFIFKGELKDYASNLIPVGDLKTGWHEFHLDNPMTIHAGEQIFIGYQATGRRPIAMAGENGREGTCYVGGSSSFVDYGGMSEYKYELAVQARLESNNFTASVTLNDFDVLYAETDKPLQIKGNVTTLTPVPVTKYVIQLQVDGKSVGQVSKKVELNEKGATDDFVLKSMSGFAAGEHTYAISLISLNSQPLETPVVREGKLIVKDILLTRRHVIEDCTGTWCPNCPRASNALEWMKKVHPDEVIGIAVHGRDEYTISDYSQLLDRVSGYPSVYINRGPKCGGGESGEQESYFNNEKKKPIEGETRIVAAEWTNASHNKVAIITCSRFAADYTEHSYRLGFVVTEDDIYAYQAGTDGWGYMYLQDVARAYDRYEGIDGSIPQQITMGEKYYTRYELNYPTNVTNRSKAHIIVLLTTQAGKAIANADIISKIDEPGTNNLEGIGTVLRPEAANLSTTYDLGGRNVTLPQRGQVYVKDGKKFIAQ